MSGQLDYWRDYWRNEYMVTGELACLRRYLEKLPAPPTPGELVERDLRARQEKQPLLQVPPGTPMPWAIKVVTGLMAACALFCFAMAAHYAATPARHAGYAPAPAWQQPPDPAAPAYSLKGTRACKNTP